MYKQLWHDDRGSVMAVEWLLVASILLAGAVAGLSVLRESIDPETRSLTSPTATFSPANETPARP